MSLKELLGIFILDRSIGLRQPHSAKLSPHQAAITSIFISIDSVKATCPSGSSFHIS
jgi:hypothetical protein